MNSLVRILVLLLETMFVCGAIGSFIVVVLAAISEARGASGHEDVAN